MLPPPPSTVLGRSFVGWVIHYPFGRRMGTATSRQICGMGVLLGQPLHYGQCRQLWSDPSWLRTQILSGSEQKLPGMPAAQSTPVSTSERSRAGSAKARGGSSAWRETCPGCPASPPCYTGSPVLPSGQHRLKLHRERLCFLCHLKTYCCKQDNFKK